MHKLLRFEKAVFSDVPELVQLVNRSYRGEQAQKGWTHEAHLLKGMRTNTEQLTADMQKTGAAIIKGTDASGHIRACVYLQQQQNNQLYLGMLTVDPEWQNCGIGKELLQQAEGYAKAQGCRIITMTVLTARTELINWYLRHGYHSNGIEKPFPADAAAEKPLLPLAFVVLQKTL